ncbi:MAG: hypothetical protein GY771_06810 [bacterium]|nr:hypothetical protein [bacterium]
MDNFFKATLAAIFIVAVIGLIGCDTEVKTGTEYVCKECGRMYRDETNTMEVPKSEAELYTVETIEGYCPKCGDEEIELEQVQHRKCPICGDDMGTETKVIKLERKMLDGVASETEVPVACGKPLCAKANRLHEKYNWEWGDCKAVAGGNIAFGYTKEMVIEAWGQPKGITREAAAETLIYDGNKVTIGGSGRVVKID